ncbi:hypothetical protein BB559_003659 [Furculomyces boomerangus]|uniref:RNA helicase n=2 Tax=Harpellales TaxID=61421 RepID=A0A2T9YJU6_9FUNG|nr:hypothetical protein BB559_003659 [Furculomyces boomerangus]PWA02611.1 hypothetical protein BB558_001255 [Smittium angustum]
MAEEKKQFSGFSLVLDESDSENPQIENVAKPKDKDVAEPEVQVKLADVQGDPNSPLYSAKTFEELGLHPDLLKGIYDLKFTKPSKIQEKALPLLLSNPPKNMIGQSQSGTGKTAAFVLTMLSRIDYSINKPQAICLGPSRELVRQIMDVVLQMGKYTPLKAQSAIKDTVVENEVVDAHLIVGTPGSLTSMIRKRVISPEKVKIFVLDEADNMIGQQGLGDQSIRIRNLMPKGCQVVLFSATFPPQVRSFASRFAPNANEISLKADELTVEGIKQFYMDCRDENHKLEVLMALYSLLTIGQSIIFVRRRDVADRIATQMTNEGHKVVSLHGKLESGERDQIMDDFRSGKTKVLITTNVIARGIDIQQVNMVINYDIPLDGDMRPDPETYLHRIGRTGRFGRTGVSINFVKDEKSFQEMKAIQDYFGCNIIRVPTDDWEETESILKKAIR